MPKTINEIIILNYSVNLQIFRLISKKAHQTKFTKPHIQIYLNNKVLIHKVEFTVNIMNKTIELIRETVPNSKI